MNKFELVLLELGFLNNHVSQFARTSTNSTGSEVNNHVSFH
jgi:hypothetical protein